MTVVIVVEALATIALIALVVALVIEWEDHLHLPWVYHWHKIRRHDAHWFARDHKVTRIICRDCDLEVRYTRTGVREMS